MPPGQRKDPLLAFSFLVEIESITVAGFSEVTGLQVESAVETYREGGVNEYEHKFFGPARYPANLVLKRGLTTDPDLLWKWFQEVRDRKITRRSITIHLLDSQGRSVTQWHVRKAYPVKWQASDLRADSNTVAIESIELVHQGITKVP